MFSAMVLGPMLAVSLAAPARAQAGSLPETYSFQGTAAMFGPPMNVQVHRNGSKELIERTREAKAGRWGAMRDRLLYDFQAHKVYYTNLETNACTVQEYGSGYAPMFDPVGGSGEMTAGAGDIPQASFRKESVNGIATKFTEVALPDGQGKYKLWLDEKSNFLVKWVVAMAGKPEETQVEIRQLSFAPSPASLFVPPAGCTPIGGVSTATGGHSEVTVEAKVPTQTHDLATGKTTGAQPEAPVMRPVPQGPAGRVTAVRLHLVPESYSGPCPGKVQLVGEITASGPGTVWYRFLAGAVSHSPEGEQKFDAAGTQTVTLDGEFRTTPRVPNAAMLASMEDTEGRHGPQNTSSGPVNYNITCTNQAPPPAPK
jgi:hypothetical protein